MAQITSSIGLISGIDTGNLINELISIDSAPVTLLQTQISSAQAQEQVYNSLGTQLSSMQQIGNTLALPQTFQDATANSSDPTVLTANANVARRLDHTSSRFRGWSRHSKASATVSPVPTRKGSARARSPWSKAAARLPRKHRSRSSTAAWASLRGSSASPIAAAPPPSSIPPTTSLSTTSSSRSTCPGHQRTGQRR